MKRHRTATPSYVPDVARATIALIERHATFGTYHCVNTGTTTWYDLATEIARELAIVGRIVPADANVLKAAAARPKFCALSNTKLLEASIEMPSWQSAIRRHLATRRVEVNT